MKKQCYRHGEVLLVKTAKLPKGLKEANTNIFMTGSHGNNHTIDKGQIYFTKDEKIPFLFGYLVAKDTNLLHPEHQDKNGKAKIEDGVYELIKQQEYTPEGLIPVQD